MRTIREAALEKDIYEATEFIADVALWLDIRDSRREQKPLNQEEYKFLFLRLNEALSTLDFHPHIDYGYAYRD